MRPNYKQIDMVGKYQIKRRNFVFKIYYHVTCYNNYPTRFLFTLKIFLFTGYNNQKYI